MKLEHRPILLASFLGLALAATTALAGCSKDNNKSKEPVDRPATTGGHTGAPPLPPVNLNARNPLGNTGPGASRMGPGAKVPVVTPSAPAGDSSYQVSIEVPAEVSAGAESVALVKVTPKTGWKMNFEFPTRLQIAPPEGVTMTKAELSREDAEKFEEKGATFAVKFKADSAGAKEFKGKFSFAVCTDATCDPKRSELAWSTQVQ